MGRIFKIIGWILLLPLLALLLFLAVKDDSGQVLITGTFPFVGPITLHATIVGFLLFALITFLVIYLGVRLITHLFGAPKTIKKMRKEHGEKVADKRYARAELALLENKPLVAEDLFVAAARYSNTPNLCYMGAAKAAELQNQPERRDNYLREIDLTDTKFDRVLSQVKRGEMLIDAGEYGKAEVLLRELLATRRNNTATLLLGVALQKQGKNEALFRLLPELRRAATKVAETPENHARIVGIYSALFDYASGTAGDAQQLKIVWMRIPKRLREDSTLLIRYAERLLDVGDIKTAETLLRQGINKTHDETLVLAYGHLYRGEMPKLLRHARKFASELPDSAAAQFTLATLLYRNHEYDEAETAAKEVIKLDPHFAKAFRLIGEIKLVKNDEKAALIAFKEASDLSLDERPKELIRKPGELLVDDTSKLDKLPENVSNVEDGEMLAKEAVADAEAKIQEDASKA